MEFKWPASCTSDYNLSKEPQIPIKQKTELESEVRICNKAPKISSVGTSVCPEPWASSLNLTTK